MSTPRESDEEHSWLPMGERTRLQRWSAPSAFAWFVISQVAIITLSFTPVFGLTGWGRVGATVAVVILLTVGSQWFLCIRFPQVEIDNERALVRIGRREMRLAQIDAARLEVDGFSRRGRSIHVVLVEDGRALARFLVASKSGRGVLAEPERQILADALRQSNIDIPKNALDPSGSFARYNFPQNITRDQAVEILLAPPRPEDPLPIQEW